MQKCAFLSVEKSGFFSGQSGEYFLRENLQKEPENKLKMHFF
jgi:hypothetical protein